MHKSILEMEQAAKPVRYEWRQFSWAAGVLAENPEWYPRTGTGTDDESGDAVVEVMLLHARALRDFLNRKRPLSKFSESDILAADFFDNPDQWTLPAFSYVSQQRTKERLDRALAHLSYDRVGYEATGKDWGFPLLVSEIQTAWQAFVAALPEERREWFTRDDWAGSP
jgi:hypothetical protein